MQNSVYVAYTAAIPQDETPFSYTASSYAPIRALVHNAFSSLALNSALSDRTVLIKPNFVRINPDNQATVTDPRVVKAVAFECLDAGAKRVQIGENPGFGLSAEKDIFSHPALQSIRECNGTIIDRIVFTPWDKEPHRKVKVEGEVLEELLVPENFLDADVVINIPKMKTHTQAVVSLGIKNWQGVSYHPERYQFHRNDLAYRLVDILSVRQPTITVIDGILPMEGQAPFFGKPLPGFNTLVVGHNVVSTDAVAAAVMGYKPSEIPAIAVATQQGYGESRLEKIAIKGQALADSIRNYGNRRPCFERAELSSMGVLPNVKSVEGGTCTGCMSSLRHSMDRALAEGMPLAETTTIYSGIPMPEKASLRKIEGAFICFGNCAAPLSWDAATRAQRATFIPGCPPNIFALYEHFENRENPTA